MAKLQADYDKMSPEELERIELLIPDWKKGALVMTD